MNPSRWAPDETLTLRVLLKFATAAINRNANTSVYCFDIEYTTQIVFVASFGVPIQYRLWQFDFNFCLVEASFDYNLVED